MTKGNDTYFFIKNLQGDVTKIIDENGNTCATYAYDAWGALLAENEDSSVEGLNPFRYRGYVYDSETELYYLQSRYYDPKTGRFVNADDSAYTDTYSGSPLSTNMFAYCENNPVIHIDINGNWYYDISDCANNFARMGEIIQISFRYHTNILILGNFQSYIFGQARTYYDKKTKKYVGFNYTNMQFGTNHKIKTVGCGAVALYNTMYHLGTHPNFAQIIMEMELNNMVSNSLNGGTKFSSIPKYLSAHHLKYKSFTYDIEIGEKDFKYDGTEKTQEITVDERLTEGTDYRIIYENNKNVGTATVSVKGINEYSGRFEKTFEIYDNGTIGDNINWELKPNGILTIAGAGEMPDYDDENKAPWSDNSASIKKILIENGITTVGSNSFTGCENLSDLFIPSSVTQIGDNATDGCTGLSGIHYEGTEEQWNEVTVGENNAKITENEIIYNSEMHLHNLKKVEAKEATYTEDGNSEYWVCEDCDKYFSDSEGENEIEKDSWIIPKLTEPTEPLTEKPTDKTTEAPSTEATEPTQSFTDETEATSAEPVITEPTQPATEITEPTQPATENTEPATVPSEPATDKPEPITEHAATKEYKFLPNSDLESRGCSYKLLVQDNKGNLEIFSFTATNIYLDGVKLYTANVSESISPTMLIYQFFEGDTWVGQVTKTYNELATVSGNIVKADGIIYGEETPTEKPTESTEPVTDKPTELVTDKPTEPVTTEPTEPVVIEPTEEPTDSTEATSTVTKSSKKKNPIKVSIKTKSVKAKKLKSKKQTVKPLTITKAKGTVKVTLVKSGTTKKIRTKVTVSKKGVITLNKGKYTKGTYKVKVKIVAKGNSKYKSKTINKTVTIKIK